LAEQIADGLPT